MRRLAAPAVSGSCFMAAALLALVLSRATDDIATIWPANAILLAALLSARAQTVRLHLAACAIAGLAANLLGGTDPALSAVFAVANVAGAAVTWHLLRLRRSSAAAFASPSDAAWFIGSAAVGVGVGATLASSATWVGGSGFVAIWLSWAVSDFLGVILLTPLVLMVLQRRPAPAARLVGLGRSYWLLAVVLLVTFTAFGQPGLPLLFVPFAAVLVATLRLGVVGAVAGTAIVAGVGAAVIATGDGHFPLASGSVAVRVRFFQFYLATLYGVCMPLAALLAERARLALERVESERRHRCILEASREVICEADLAGCWTYLNPAWEALTGHPVERTIGRPCLDFVDPRDRAAATQRLRGLYDRSGDECRQDVRYVHADGRVLWASVRSQLRTDESGRIVGTYGTIHDVTGRVAAQAAQVESERLYRLLADHSNDMIVHFDTRGVRRYVSPASVALLGYTPEELTGEVAAGAIHPDDRAAVLATCRTLLDGAENPICAYRQLHKDGRYVWLEASYRLIRDEATGAPDGFIASVRDIGRRTEAEYARTTSAAKLEEANRLLTLAEEMSGVGHWRLDLPSGHIFWSDMVCAIHGRPAGFEPTLADALEAYHPDDRSMVQQAVAGAHEAGQPYRLKARILRTDGAVRHVMMNGRTERGPDGSAIGLLGVFQDVTEAHEAQTALLDASARVADSNRMLTMAEAVASVGHWRIDAETGIYFWSDEVYRIYGLDRSYVPTFADTIALFHPDDRDRAVETVRSSLAAGVGYSLRARIMRQDGSIRHLSVRGEFDRTPEGVTTGRFGIIQDMSEQAQAEEQLRLGEARFRLMTDQASDMISIQDPDGRCMFMSPAARTVLGYEPDAMLGTRPQDYAPPEDHVVLEQHHAKVRRSEPGTVSTLRFRMRHADGGLRWMEVAARLSEYEGEPCVIAVARNVSEQVAGEDALREARTQAEAAVQAKSSFLANMSHEIRTPMNGVVGFTELLLASDLAPEQRRQAELIADSSRAMMRLLNDILDLSKVEAGQMTVAQEPFDLIHALKACMMLIAPVAEQKGLELRCAFNRDLPHIVTGDALRLRQIVLNLLANAAKFTAAGEVVLSTSIDAGEYLAIEVCDTGIGIAPDRQEAIFEPFIQADGGIAPRFGGTGLGLAISHQLAGLMGGTLSLDSRVGHGTRFTLRLPLAQMLTGRTVAAKASEPMAPALRQAGVRLLVAEDHDVNQMLITAMLEKLGITPEIARDGREAVAMVAAAVAEERPYALVFMDVQMPELNGMEATRAIRAAGVDEAALPIVALTANAYADDVAACLAAGMQAHMSKPFSLEALEAAIRRWLPQRSAVAPQGGAARFSPRLQQRYQARKQETLERLSALLRAGTFADTELGEVAAMLHKLAGTAEMFGDVTLGVEARSLEAGLEHWAGADREERIMRAAEAIRRAA